jgi:hypothetical protein
MVVRTALGILFIFAAVIASQFVKGVKLKLIYWMIMVLLFITLINIFLTIKYYIHIRDNPGIKGARGNSGKAGPKGSMGVCKISTSCREVYDCKNLIQEKLQDNSASYAKIIKKFNKNELLSQPEKTTLSKVNEFIDILAQRCESMNKEQLLEELELSLEKQNYFST